MGLFSRLNRAAGRFNRRFGAFAAATDVQGSAQMNTPATQVLRSEIEDEVGSGESREPHDADPSDE